MKELDDMIMAPAEAELISGLRNLIKSMTETMVEHEVADQINNEVASQVREEIDDIDFEGKADDAMQECLDQTDIPEQARIQVQLAVDRFDFKDALAAAINGLITDGLIDPKVWLPARLPWWRRVLAALRRLFD